MSSSTEIQTTVITIYEPDFDPQTDQYVDLDPSDIFEYSGKNKHKNLGAVKSRKIDQTSIYF